VTGGQGGQGGQAGGRQEEQAEGATGLNFRSDHNFRRRNLIYFLHLLARETFISFWNKGTFCDFTFSAPDILKSHRGGNYFLE
jgi:hypothetical protein